MDHIQTDKKRLIAYFIGHVVVSGIMLFWYFINYYVPLDGVTGKWNYVVFFIIYSLMFLGFYGSFRDDAGAAFILLDVLIPIELYAIIARESYATGPERTEFIIIFSILISAIAFHFIKHGFGERQAKFAYLLITVVVIPIAVMTVFVAGPDMSSPVQLKDSNSFNQNIHNLEVFEDNRWNRLEDTKKIKALKKVIEVERNELGFPYDIKFEITNLNSDNNEEEYREQAVFHWDTETILLDEQYYLEARGSDIYKTMVHECYHAYQYGLIQMYQYIPRKYRNLQLLDIVRYYEVELNNYDGGEDTFMTYYYQQLEYQARKHAEERLEELKEKID